MPPELTGTQTIHPNSEAVAPIPQIEYSEAAKTHILFRRRRMVAARDIRDGRHEEFDDMTFLKQYDTNLKADNQYVAPRKNKQDTSLNTGTIRDKDTSLVEYAAKYDFEPVAQVFDESDDMLEELADLAEDLVRKSLLLEQYKEKMKLIYRSMVAFGTAMVEDQWIERWEIEKTFGAVNTLGSLNTEWTERKTKKYDGCQMKLWDLRKIYFGDIRKFFLNGPQGQPYMFTVEYESYDMTKQMFGDWDRWENVPTTVAPTPDFGMNNNSYVPGWTLRPISPNYCEIVRYYDPIMNEFAITINGIDMLPIQDRVITVGGIQKQLVSGFPLTAVSPSGAIPFAKYDLEPMHDFVYSKAQPAKMRVMADVENMWLKLMLGMMKQRAYPTVGNKSGRNFDYSVTMPASLINDIREGDIFPVLPDYRGAQPADMSFYQLIKKELSKNSVEDSFQGIDETQQDETATGDMNNMKAQSLKVGALFDGIISGNNQLYWLRTYNIAKNWTKPIDVRVDSLTKGLEMKYRTVTMPTEIDGGQKATKKIVFTRTPPKGNNYKEMSDTVHQQELDHAKESGGEIRMSYLNPDQFATMKLNWFYACIPVPNGADPLAYMMFSKQIQDAALMFGPDSLNVKKLKHKFAKVTGEDFDTWFLNEQELQQKQQAAAQAQAQTQEGINPGGAPGMGTNGPGAAGSAGGGPSAAGAIQGKLPAQAMSAAIR